MLNEQETWQIEVQNQVYEADFEELIQWINEGSVKPEDKVRRGNLRWIEAGKVPLLYGIFNAQEFDIDVKSFLLTTDGEKSAENLKDYAKIQNFLQNEAKTSEKQADFADDVQMNAAKNQEEQKEKRKSTDFDVCSIHPESEPRYICTTCQALFCKKCPTSYGGDVKICPDCGAMCKSYEDEGGKVKSVGSMNKPYVRTEDERLYAGKNSAQNKFGFSDFAASLIYPFKFKASLIFGAVLLIIFALGQSVWVFGGAMLVSAIFCAMLANTLTFGILANTLENFSQGKITADFMPRFDDFSAWDDVIQPFMLSIGVYLISFGFLIALLIGATWNTVNSLKEIDAGKDKIVSLVLPVPPNDLVLAKQSAEISQLTERNKASNAAKQEISAAETSIVELQNVSANQETELKKLQNQIKQSQQTQIDQFTKENSENEDNYLSEMPGNVMRLSLGFSIPIFLTFLWGVFYFPAACAVAAYTRSFTATLNPLIGFDTIKRLGFDYAKVLGVILVLGVLAIIINIVLGKFLSPLDLPQIGNIPIKIVDGFLYFYFSIVFSVTLGFVLYKNSSRLNFK